MPAICDFRTAKISIGVQHSEPVPFSIPTNFYKTLQVHAEDGSSLGTSLNAAIGRWNAGSFPTEEGTHEGLDLFPGGKVKVDNGQGQLTWVRIYVGLRVSRTLFFGQVPLSKVSGFADETTGLLHTNGFEIGVISAEEVYRKWQRVTADQELPVKPVLQFTGLVTWESS